MECPRKTLAATPAANVHESTFGATETALPVIVGNRKIASTVRINAMAMELIWIIDVSPKGNTPAARKDNDAAMSKAL